MPFLPWSSELSLFNKGISRLILKDSYFPADFLLKYYFFLGIIVDVVA